MILFVRLLQISQDYMQQVKIRLILLKVTKKNHSFNFLKMS